MPSLRQLLAAHAPLLVVDAASARVQVGWLAADGNARWSNLEEEAGLGVFHGVRQLGIDVNAAGAFAFCDGPGSVLGIRTAAMALRTWCALAPRPVFAYGSLALVAQALASPGTTVIADARRDSWHCLVRGGALRRVATKELRGPLAMPENFRHWSPLPAGVQTVPYSVAELLSRVKDAELFRTTEAPDAFLQEEPSYAAWVPQVHRAPATP